VRLQATRIIITVTALLSACVSSSGFVEDTRTMGSIQAAFDRSKHAIYHVYAEALKRNPGLTGRVVYRITVNADGKVVNSVVIKSLIDDPEVPVAINQIILGMSFGKVRHRGNVTFNYPMDFIPKKRDTSGSDHSPRRSG
jgi:hypothetical protein